MTHGLSITLPLHLGIPLHRTDSSHGHMYHLSHAHRSLCDRSGGSWDLCRPCPSPWSALPPGPGGRTPVACRTPCSCSRACRAVSGLSPWHCWHRLPVRYWHWRVGWKIGFEDPWERWEAQRSRRQSCVIHSLPFHQNRKSYRRHRRNPHTRNPPSYLERHWRHRRNL